MFEGRSPAVVVFNIICVVFLLLLLFTFWAGSSIESFIQALRQQNIALEVDAFGARHGPDEPSYNGAITVSGDDKVRGAPTAAPRRGWPR